MHMKIQKLGEPYKTRFEAEQGLTRLFYHAVKVADNKWQNGTSQIWIDSNNQIVINYGK